MKCSYEFIRTICPEMKLEWKPYFEHGAHLVFETLDEDKDFDEMLRILTPVQGDRSLLDYIRFHVERTKAVFNYNYGENERLQKMLDHAIPPS